MAIAAQLPQPDLDAIVGLICQSIEHTNQQRLPDALACLDAGLRIHPGFFPCRVARARLLARMARFEEALADLSQVLRLVRLPDVLAEFFRILEAALALGHDSFVLHMAHGNALYELGRYREAVSAYESALARDAGAAHAWCNLGNALQKQGRLCEAIDAYQRAIGIAPELAEAWLEQAHCRLALGEFAEGWRLYEWRWHTAQLEPSQLSSGQPRWLGATTLEGKTILLWAEQGFGDTIQFARFIPRVAEQAGKVIVRLPEPLRVLFGTLDRRIALIGDGEPLPPHDCHCPLMSLPLALGLDDEAALAGGACLTADPGRVAAWRVRLGPAGRPRIGLAWSGRKAGAAGACNPSRDMPPSALLPLLGLAAQFISLQKEYAADDDVLLARLPPQALGHFADTAALIACLDLVITVDTAVAHLAGALGKPCWLLLRRSSEWRWQLRREDSPWYASITIFRQQVEGDWDGLVQRVAAKAAALVSAQGSDPTDSGRRWNR